LLTYVNSKELTMKHTKAFINLSSFQHLLMHY